MQNRMAALATEHREVRNHWLSEKSDLEGRFHQMQALHTQLQGTLKKREKDYDKLQGQLAKLVRDSVRGNKACMTISLPLKKNLSQDSSSIKTTAALLKDAEVIANKAALSSMLVDNLSRDFCGSNFLNCIRRKTQCCGRRWRIFVLVSQSSEDNSILHLL